MFQRRADASDPVRSEPLASLLEERRSTLSWYLGTGTLACPRCDAPVATGGEPLAPAAPLTCPFCSHGGPLRDFLTLGEPTRPARVEVRLVPRVRS
jgi:hypothetical protein